MCVNEVFIRSTNGAQVLTFKYTNSNISETSNRRKMKMLQTVLTFTILFVCNLDNNVKFAEVFARAFD